MHIRHRDPSQYYEKKNKESLFTTPSAIIRKNKNKMLIHRQGRPRIQPLFWSFFPSKTVAVTSHQRASEHQYGWKMTTDDCTVIFTDHESNRHPGAIVLSRLFLALTKSPRNASIDGK